MARIAVDLDDTLILTDEDEVRPVPGAAEAMSALKIEGHKIFIHTCRTTIAKANGTLEAELKWIKDTLNTFGIAYDEIYTGDKVIADLYIDDRALTFDGRWDKTLNQVFSILD